MIRSLNAVRVAPLLRFALLSTAALAMGVVASACGDDQAAGSSGKLNVVATIAPTGALTRAVGGDLIELTVLAGSGVDPHEYELTVDGRKAIDRAKVIIRNGLEIDAFLDKAIGENKAKVVTVTDGLNLIDGDEAEKKADPNAKDPHVWHDPANDKAMVDVIAAALAKADSANAAAYMANATAYKAKLDETDRQVRALIDTIPAENRKLVTNHDAFGYFIRRYGLAFVGAVIPSQTTQAEPSAKDIAALVDLIRREKVKAIFAESSIDPKVARQIAKDTGVKIVDDLYGDSLGEPGSGADTIDGLLLANARKIVEALK